MEKIKQQAESVIFDKDEEGLPIINIRLNRYQVRDLHEALVDYRNQDGKEEIEIHFTQI
jgi:hypothetical protein